MLTKEECENALTNILCNIGVARSDYRTSGKAKEDYHTLKSLIEEHFSNPPLTWEELKECNVVYDKKLKKYRLINELLEDGFIYFTYTTDTRIGEYYEPNRFYRKEVQEWTN